MPSVMTAPGTRIDGDSSAPGRSGANTKELLRSGSVEASSPIGSAAEGAYVSGLAAAGGRGLATRASATRGPATRKQVVLELAERASRLVSLPLAFALGGWALAAHQRDLSESAETSYLVVIGCCVLAAIAALDFRWTGIGRASIMVLPLACLWLLHGDPERGAAFVLVLVGLLAVAAMRAFSERGSRVAVAIPAALGVQFLARPDLFLPPFFDARTLVSLFVLPPVAAVCLCLLAHRFGSSRGAIAFLLVSGLAPGFNLTVTLCLLLLVGVGIAGPRIRELSQQASKRLGKLGSRAIPTFVVTIAAGPGLIGAGVVAAGIVHLKLGMPLAWLGLVGGLALYFTDRRASESPSSEVASSASVWPIAAAGTILAAAGWWIEADPQSTLVGLALFAVALPAKGAWHLSIRGVAFVLLVLSVLSAGYPWLRADPWRALPRAVSILLASPTPALLEGATLSLGHRPLDFDLVGTPLGPIPLDPENPPWAIVETRLVHGADLAPETPVLWVEMLDENGQMLTALRLHSGRDTAEWAAGRADLVAVVPAPDPFSHRVAPDGTFFARRYRSTLRTRPRPAAEEGSVVTRVRLRRAKALPHGVEIQVDRLEVRP